VFNEESEFDIAPSDTTNVKKSKENLTKVKTDVDNYNKQKAKIDLIYKNAKDDSEIEAKVNDLLGKDKEKRNPYLINYLTVADGERKLKKLVGDKINNKLKADEYRDLIAQSTDDNQKKDMQQQILDLTNKNADISTELIKLKADSAKRKAIIDTSSSKNLKDMQIDIKNISKSIK